MYIGKKLNQRFSSRKVKKPPSLNCDKNPFPSIYFFTVTHSYRVGITIRVNKVDDKRPPMTTIARGFCKKSEMKKR